MKIRNLTVLNTREVKQIHEQLEQEYGYQGKLDYAFLKNNRDRIYILHRDIDKVPIDKLRIDSAGLYFATSYPSALRLTMEGSQIIGPQAKKNVLDIDKEQTKAWFRGEDLVVDKALQGFHLIRHSKDYLGCGKARDGKLYNYLPKTRRIIPEHTPNE